MKFKVNDSKFEKLVQFTKAKRAGSGEQWVGLCPAHDDRKSSFSFREDDEKGLLCFCHAGCSFEEIRESLVGHGCWPIEEEGSSLLSEVRYRNSPRGRDSETGTAAEATIALAESETARDSETVRQRDTHEEGVGRVVEAEYLYSPLAKRVRYRPKDFRWYHRDSDLGVWIPGLNGEGAELPLYREGEVLEAKQTGTPVWFPEGEKDVETLRALGLVATTTAHSSKLEKRHLDALGGADVVLLYDNDDAGRSRRDKLLSALLNSASLRVVNLPNQIGDKRIKDVTDFVQAGGSKAQLLELAAQAKVAGPIKLCPLSSYIEQTGPAPELLMAPWLTANSLNMMCGIPGSGKSLLAMGLAAHLAAGRDFLGWKCSQRRRVVVLDGEMRRDQISRRFLEVFLAMGLTYTARLDAMERIQILDREIFDAREQVLPDLVRDHNEAGRILGLIAEFRPDVVVLDNLNCWAPPDDENSARSWAGIQKLMFQMRGLRVALLVIHHAPKSNPRTPAGSSRATRALDISIIIDRVMENGGVLQFNLEFQKTREKLECPLQMGVQVLRRELEGGIVTDFELTPFVEKQLCPVEVLPSEADLWREEARRLHEQGISVRNIAKKLRKPVATVGRSVKREPGAGKDDL